MNRLNRTDQNFSPLRVVQFGEGNFLRASVDWMIQQLNDQGLFDGSVQIVQPIPEGLGDVLSEQGGLYTAQLIGILNNHVDQRQLISCVRGSINAYRDWQSVLDLAGEETLRFVFSNTTEAGIEYLPEPWQHDQTPMTFPAKLTAFLFERFQKFGNEPSRGLIVIPCESIERNGSKLKSCVLRYADDWELGDAFVQWLETENQFLNALVDRIVFGYPKSGVYAKINKLGIKIHDPLKDADDICQELGYEDLLLVTAEPYCFFVIEGPESLDEELPLRKAGLNVVWTDDITPYKARYDRILNGARIAMAPAAYLWGSEFIHGPAMSHVFNSFLHRFLEDEVLPMFNLPESEIHEIVNAILRRLQNTWVSEELLSVSYHSVSKWKTCVLPTLLDYRTKYGRLPELTVFSLAALIVFNRVTIIGSKGDVFGSRNFKDTYKIQDDKEVLEFFHGIWKDFEEDGDFRILTQRVLAQEDFWGRDLNEIEPLTEQLAIDLRRILHNGVSRTANSIIFKSED